MTQEVFDHLELFRGCLMSHTTENSRHSLCNGNPDTNDRQPQNCASTLQKHISCIQLTSKPRQLSQPVSPRLPLPSQ